MRSTSSWQRDQFDFHGAEYFFGGMTDVSDSSNLDADSASMFVCSTEDSDITESSVDDVVILSNLIMSVTHVVRCKACNDVSNSTMIAASDPIVASTLADPPYIPEVVVMVDVKLTVFLALEQRVSCDNLRVHWCFGMGLHGRGARDQLSGCWARLLVSVCRSYCGRSLTIFHRVTDGNCQGATTAAGLPLHPPRNQTVVVEVASIPANASFASTTSIVCGASIQQSANFSQFALWTFVEGLQ